MQGDMLSLLPTFVKQPGTMDPGDDHDWPEQCTKHNPKSTSFKWIFSRALCLMRALAKQMPLRVSYEPKTCTKENKKTDKGCVVHYFYPT